MALFFLAGFPFLFFKSFFVINFFILTTAIPVTPKAKNVIMAILVFFDSLGSFTIRQ